MLTLSSMLGFDPDSPAKGVPPSIVIPGELLNKDSAVGEVEPGYISGFVPVVKVIVGYGSGHSVIIHADALGTVRFEAGDAWWDYFDLILD